MVTFDSVMIKTNTSIFEEAIPLLYPDGIGEDEETKWETKSPLDLLCEFSARVCYKSDKKIGYVENFLRGRIDEGHLDVLEHAWATIQFNASNIVEIGFEMMLNNPYCRIKVLNEKQMLVSANMRVWRAFTMDDTFSEFCKNQLKVILFEIAPKIIYPKSESFQDFKPMILRGCSAPAIFNTLGQKVTPLGKMGFNYPEFGLFKMGRNMASTTFLFEGVSRALTHQLVRHRAGSFSQESQRYVDLEKGSWLPIIPPDIDKKGGLEPNRTIFQNMWSLLEQHYKALRDEDVLMQDARYMLPNACETRIVVTMPDDGWFNFFEQRALDVAAQWEIRALAQTTLKAMVGFKADSFNGQFNRLISSTRSKLLIGV